MNQDMLGRFMDGVTFPEGNGKGIGYARGTTVPADASTGYAKGCIFIKTDGGVGSTFYVNEGSVTSADFNAK